MALSHTSLSLRTLRISAVVSAVSTDWLHVHVCCADVGATAADDDAEAEGAGDITGDVNLDHDELYNDAAAEYDELGDKWGAEDDAAAQAAAAAGGGAAGGGAGGAADTPARGQQKQEPHQTQELHDWGIASEDGGWLKNAWEGEEFLQVSRTEQD
jgi:hypothetical protein